MILLLQTTTFSVHGGIPTYNRVVCRTLQDLAPDLEKRLLILTDSSKDIELRRGELSKLEIAAFSGARLRMVLDLFRTTLTKPVDLFLIGHVNYAVVGLLLKLVMPQIRYGVMVHGVEVWSRLPRLKRYALQRADFITSVSQYTKDQVVNLNGVAPDLVYLLPNALDCLENLRLENDPVLPAGLNLLSVCRLNRAERYKGIDTVIDALPAVIQEIPLLNYYVIGDGDDLERHKALAREKGVADRVHFLGSVGNYQLHHYYNSCDVFVMPSSGEGFGIVYLEAMQHQKPVVAARSGAAPEVVLDGITGRLVDYGNKEQLARTLIELCHDSEQRRELGSAGYQRLQSNFTFNHFKETFTKILSRELPSQKACVELQEPLTAPTAKN